MELKYCENCGKPIEINENYIFICDDTYCVDCIAASGYFNGQKNEGEF